MWKPKWACTICGMLSSRRYSVQRHIRNLHTGIGFVVSYVDYMAGTLAGIYKPNSILSQASKRNVKHLDRLHMKNALEFSYSRPFALTTQFGMYSTNYSPRYYDELNKVMKSSTESASTPDFMNIVKSEFASELGRGLARNLLYPTEANRQSFNTNTINKVSQSLYPFRTIGGDEIFGYRFQICKDCLLIDPLAVCYPKDGKSARTEYKHACNPILVASNRDGIDKESSVKNMYKMLAENFINFVNGQKEKKV
jgi:hypothetical protein